MHPTPDRDPVRLYKRGRVWYTWIYPNGSSKPRHVSTHQTSRTAAVAAARRIEAEGQGAASTVAREPYSVSQALDRLLDVHEWKSQRTLSSHESRACQMARHMGELDLALLTRERIEEFRSARREEVSDHSISKEFVLLRLALRLAEKEGHFEGDITKLFPKHKANYRPRERWLPPEEASALLSAFPPGRRLWLQVALYTGARFDEVNSLAWADVDFGAYLVRVRGTKTDSADRVIPLAPELRTILEPLRSTGLVCGAWPHAGRDIKRACKRIGILPATPNDLRRTTASWMVQAGIPAERIAKWLGHKSLEMVQRVYARLNPEHLRDAAASLPALQVDVHCSVFAKALCGESGSEQAKKETAIPSSQREPPFSERACRDSNAGPLASEARAKVGRRRVTLAKGKQPTAAYLRKPDHATLH